MARLKKGVALAALLAPAVAWAQDATVLAVAFGPPLIAAPFLAQYVRARSLLPRNGTSAAPRAWIVAGIVEVLLWVFVGYMAAMVVFEERWLALILLGAGLAALLYTLRGLGAPHRSWGFTLKMLAVFPAVMAVAMVFSLVIAFMFG